MERDLLIKRGLLRKDAIRVVSPVEVFTFIDAEKTSFPIAFKCHRLGAQKLVSRLKGQPLAERAVGDTRITK